MSKWDKLILKISALSKDFLITHNQQVDLIIEIIFIHKY